MPALRVVVVLHSQFSLGKYPAVRGRISAPFLFLRVCLLRLIHVLNLCFKAKVACREEVFASVSCSIRIGGVIEIGSTNDGISNYMN